MILRPTGSTRTNTLFPYATLFRSSSARDGRFIERLGYYNPNAKGQEQKLTLDLARVEHWQKNGAQLSDRVAYLVKTATKAAASAGRSEERRVGNECVSTCRCVWSQ